MAIKIIMFLIIGIAIGMQIEDKAIKSLMKSKEDLIKDYKALVSEQAKNIKLYVKYFDELYNMYNESLNGIDKLVAENIKLKKKLKDHE